MAPLLNYIPPNGRTERTPTKEEVMGISRSGTVKKTLNWQHPPEKRLKLCNPPENFDNSQEQFNPETSFSNHLFDFHDYNLYSNPYYNNVHISDDFLQGSQNSLPPIKNSMQIAAKENRSERHRAAIMALFLNSNLRSYEMLYPQTKLPADFDVDLILDDHGHTALHWASALANITLLSLLIQKGAQISKLNYNGESALIRSVMVNHNNEKKTFPDLLNTLKDTILISDKKNRTVLHHICLAASVKNRSATCSYYMKCILDFFSKLSYDEEVSAQLVYSDNGNSFSKKINASIDLKDFCGDTAVNIAARLGNRDLFDQLVEAGADVNIVNYAGLKPADFGFENKEFRGPEGYITTKK